MEKGISAIQVSLVLVGTIMGAGFASGREIWTFFGSFGKIGYIGILLTVVLYIFICLVGVSLAKALKTKDFGKIVSPSKNDVINDYFGYVLAFMLWLVMITMTAAGGAICAQQFGISKIIGGLAVLVAVLITVFGDFERISKVFRLIMPVLMVVMILTCIVILFADVPYQGYTDIPMPSPFAPKWYLSSMVYMCFNIYGTIPICIITASKARSEAEAKKGIFLGGIFIGILAVLMVSVTMIEPSFSQAMDMPLLAYSAVVSKPLNYVFTITLMLAIYASASSNFYGYTLKLKEGKNKKPIMVLAAFVAFLIGLVGFKNVVSYMFSAAGIFGIGIFILLVINYFRFVVAKK